MQDSAPFILNNIFLVSCWYIWQHLNCRSPVQSRAFQSVSRRWRPKEQPMFWPPHFSQLKNILIMPCVLEPPGTFTPPNLTCLLSDASHAWEATPSTSVRAREHYDSWLLHMAAQTDPVTYLTSCSPHIHQCTARTRPAMCEVACSTLWPSQKFQKTYSPVAYSWPEQEGLHAMKPYTKEQWHLYSSSNLIQALSSFSYLQMGRVVRGQSSWSTEIIILNSTKLNFNLNALKSATSPNIIIIYISRHSPSKSLAVVTAQLKCCLLKLVTRLSGANHGILDLER